MPAKGKPATTVTVKTTTSPQNAGGAKGKNRRRRRNRTERAGRAAFGNRRVAYGNSKMRSVLARTHTDTVNGRVYDQLDKLASLDGNSAGASLARCIALPDELCMQFPTDGAESTDVRKLKVLSSLASGLTSPGKATAAFPQYSNLVAFFGEPGRFICYWRDQLTTTYNAQFEVTLNDGSLSTSTTWVALNDSAYAFAALKDTSLNASFDAPVPIVGLYNTSGGFHGPWLPAAVTALSETNFIFLNTGDTLAISVLCGYNGGIPVAGEIEFSLTMFQLPGRPSGPPPTTSLLGSNGIITVPMPSASGNTSTTTYSCVAPGYYGLFLAGASMQSLTAGAWVNRFSVSVAVTAGLAAGWSNYCLPELITPSLAGVGGVGIPQLGYEARVNAASILISNTTPELTRGGTVTAVRFDKSAMFYNRNYAEFGAVSNDLYNGLAKDGVYTFKESTHESGIFRRHCSVLGPLINLDYGDKYAMILIIPPGASQPQTFATTMVTCHEFRVASQLLATRKPCRLSMESLHQARVRINGVNQWFFENPLHLATIYNWIKKGARSLVNHAPKLLGAASLLAPQHAIPLNTLGTLLSQLRV